MGINAHLDRVVGRSRRAAVTLASRPGVSGNDVTKLGSEFGGWYVPTELIKPGWVAYCAGVGEDMTFDLQLLQLGCEVHAFDPTPRAIAHVESHGTLERYEFHPIGLWSEHDVLRFYAPENPAFVSHSALNLQKTNTFFEAEVDSVGNLMRRLGHDHVDLLKMDIEGAEHKVLPSLQKDGIRPTVLCVEFDQPMPAHRVLREISRLKAGGYRLIKQDRWNFTFLR
jgi:FkbM family methyltransferase